MVCGPVEILQRLHALVPRAARRIAVIQDRLQEDLALGVVSVTRSDEIRHETATGGERGGEGWRGKKAFDSLASGVSVMTRAGEHDLHRLLHFVRV